MKYVIKSILDTYHFFVVAVGGWLIKTAALPPPVPLVARVSEYRRDKHPTILKQ